MRGDVPPCTKPPSLGEDAIAAFCCAKFTSAPHTLHRAHCFVMRREIEIAHHCGCLLAFLMFANCTPIPCTEGFPLLSNVSPPHASLIGSSQGCARMMPCCWWRGFARAKLHTRTSRSFILSSRDGTSVKRELVLGLECLLHNGGRSNRVYNTTHRLYLTERSKRSTHRRNAQPDDGRRVFHSFKRTQLKVTCTGQPASQKISGK